MERKRWFVFIAALLVGMFIALSPIETIAEVQNDALQTLSQEEVAERRSEIFGTNCCAILQIPASSFVPRSSDVTYGYWGDGVIYPTTTTSPGGGQLWATVTLPSGAIIRFLDLYYYDTNATHNITARLRAYYGTLSPAYIDIASVSSTGSAGYGFTYSAVNHTVNNDVQQGGGYQYTVLISSPAGDSSLRFRGVAIWWQRQVSPAPSTASFADVPTTHPFFQFIEALYASGITGGCATGPLRYCPDAPLTRGQMAVFLSRALGLHWDH